ncbi:hypothetical protein CP8484711_0790A, partial [Chlamydia psittaci 84-8471/1]|jgi:hypothetical protein
MEEV